MPDRVTRRNLLQSGLAFALAGSFQSRAFAHSDHDMFKDLDHEHFMRLAIEQAKKVPLCPFGTVIVNMRTKAVVAEGWVKVDKNPIWHGEMTALANCPDSDSGFNWHEMCLYTTGESCPMCQSAIIWTKMPLVVYGTAMPFLQSCGFGEINIRCQTVANASHYSKCTIIGGVLREECDALFRDAQRMNSQKRT